MSKRTRGSVYQQWAKTLSGARYNLASSGVRNYPLAALPATLDDLELSGASWYGYEPLQQALAAHCDVPVECVVAATGTSMANHLVMAALVDPGDEVVVEHPAYDPLVAVAEYLGAEVRRFARRHQNGFRIDADEIGRQLSPRTKLILFTNLHNPSGALTDERTLKEVSQLARKAGAYVVVDEVYLDAVFEQTPRSAFHLGEEFIVTSSLTKVYGLSGVRCGWILARPDLAKQCWHLNDLFGVIPAHAAERLSVIALRNLEQIRRSARDLLDENGEALSSFLRSRDDLEVLEHRYGTVSFPRLKHKNVSELCSLLATKYETSIVPGDFFEMPDHFRIGIGGDPAIVREGLSRLSFALDELRPASPGTPVSRL